MEVEESIFDAARRLPPGDERLALLESRCGDNAELRARIDRLLRAQDAAGSFLEKPASGVSPTGEQETVDLYSTGDTARSGGAALPNDALPGLEPCDTPDRLGKLGVYEVTELLGRGGMGTVLRAWDTKLHRTVALKLMSPELASKPQAKERFLREARSAAAVVDEHIVSIYSIEDSREPPLLVMEFVEGETLGQKIARVGALPVAEVMSLGKQLATGLAAAHSTGLIHRDIKPANVLLEHGTDSAKITDFGLARATDSVELTQSGMILGTPQYMSPEQARGEVVDHRSDLFSLGRVLYAACTGQAAFPAKTTVGALHRVCHDEPTPIRELNPKIPRWLSEAVDRLMTKRREDRFQTCEEFIQALSSRRANARTHSPHRQERKRLRPAALAALAALLTAGTLGVCELTGVTRLFGVNALLGSAPEPEATPPRELTNSPEPSVAPSSSEPSPTEILTSPDWEWTKPMFLTGRVFSQTISGDGLTIINTTKNKSTGKRDLYISTRQSRDRTFVAMWNTMRNIGPPVNTESNEYDPCLLSQGLKLAYVRQAEDGSPRFWISSRKSLSDSFDAGEQLVVPNTDDGNGPFLTDDERTLFFHSAREGGHGDEDLWVCVRETAKDPFENPINLGPAVNSPARDTDPILTSDGLTLVFSSNRDGAHRIWMATRPAVDKPFGTPTRLSPVLDVPGSRDLGPSLTDDGRTLIFCTYNHPHPRLHMSIRLPKGEKHPPNVHPTIQLLDFVRAEDLQYAVETGDWRLAEQAAIARLSADEAFSTGGVIDALTILAGANNADGYQTYSEKFLRIVGKNRDFWSCYHAAIATLLMPCDESITARSAALLERAKDIKLKDRPGELTPTEHSPTELRRLLGYRCLARYRQGQYEEALEMAEPEIQQSNEVWQAGMALIAAAAMSHHELGDAEKAREYLEILERDFRQLGTISDRITEARYWIVYKVLLEEARSVIRPGEFLLSGLMTDVEFRAASQSNEWGAVEQAALARLASPSLNGQQHIDALIALAIAGNQPAYEESTSRLLSSFWDTGDFQASFSRSRVAFLLPCDQRVTKQAVDLLETTGRSLPQVTSDRWHYYAYLGLSRYRQGRFRDAIGTVGPQLEQDTGSPAKSAALATLAMSNHQLGKGRQAREALANLQQLVSDWENQDLSVEEWRELISAQVLLREAQSLIEPSAP